MAIHSAVGATSKGAVPAQQVSRLAAPSQGIDGRIGLAADSQEHCIYTYNILSGSYGMKVRKGYREYVLNVEDTASTGIKLLIPYTGALTAESDDRLFAVTNEGIWNVSTDADVAPTKMLTFGTTTAGAGEGVYTSYITDADAHLIFYADPVNGLFTYDGAGGTWAQTTGITGVTITSINFIVVHKLRIWLIESGSSNAWYLPIGAIAGAATRFHFGAQFRHGGRLVGLYNWTLDGGAGVDDWLVAVSDAGDVIPYSGDDPSLSSWVIQGVFFVGAVAGKAQCASQTGGDLHILSTKGLTSMTDILQGIYANDLKSNSLGSKMAYAIRRDMASYRTVDGWAVNFLPSDGLLLLNTPQRTDGTFIQYAYDIATDSFGFWRDVPALSFTSWRSDIYIGTADNRVLVMDVDRDNVTIVPPAGDLVNGLDIQFSVLLTFNDLGSPALYKRPNMVRADFISDYGVNYAAKYKFDYVIGEASGTVTAPASDATGWWDAGIWGTALWGSIEQFSTHDIRGSFGYGRSVAVAIKGAGRSNTWLMSVDVMWTPAGAL